MPTLSELILDMLEAKTAYLEFCNTDDDINAQILYEEFLKTQDALDAWKPE